MKKLLEEEKEKQEAKMPAMLKEQEERMREEEKKMEAKMKAKLDAAEARAKELERVTKEEHERLEQEHKLLEGAEKKNRKMSMMGMISSAGKDAHSRKQLKEKDDLLASAQSEIEKVRKEALEERNRLLAEVEEAKATEAARARVDSTGEFGDGMDSAQKANLIKDLLLQQVRRSDERSSVRAA